MIRILVTATLLGTLSAHGFAQDVVGVYSEQRPVAVGQQFNHAAVVQALGGNSQSCKACHTSINAMDYAADARYVFGVRYDGGMRIGSYVVSPLTDKLFRSHLPIDSEAAWLVQSSAGATSEDSSLTEGDVLLAIDGKSVEDFVEIKKVIDANRDSTVGVELIRKGEKKSMEIDANALSEPLPPYRIGVQIEAPSEALRAQLNLYENEGLLVVDLLDDSPAIEAGLEMHDVLLRANGERLSDSQGLSGVVNATQGKKMTLTVLRGGKEVSVDVTPVRAPKPVAVSIEYCPSFHLQSQNIVTGYPLSAVHARDVPVVEGYPIKVVEGQRLPVVEGHPIQVVEGQKLPETDKEKE